MVCGLTSRMHITEGQHSIPTLRGCARTRTHTHTHTCTQSGSGAPHGRAQPSGRTYMKHAHTHTDTKACLLVAHLPTSQFAYLQSRRWCLQLKCKENMRPRTHWQFKQRDLKKALAFQNASLVAGAPTAPKGSEVLLFEIVLGGDWEPKQSRF